MSTKAQYLFPDAVAGFFALSIILVSLSSPSAEIVQTASWIFKSDQLGHFAGYSILGFLSLYRRQNLKATLIIVLCLITLGGMIELIQETVGRSAEFTDFIANVAGILFAWSIMSIFRSMGSLSR